MATDVIAKNPDVRSDSQLSFLANRKKMVAPEMTEQQKEMKANRLRMQRDYTSLSSRKGERPNRVGTLSPNIDYTKFKGLIVLVEFSDRKFLTEDPRSLYQKLTSEKNYQDTSHEHYPVDVEGSARDYFYDNSMGFFDPTFDVVGPVQISKKATDAGGRNSSNQIMGAIFKEALLGIDSQVDFSQYDMDNNGTIDMIYFIFAGYGSYIQGNNSNYIWPHAQDFSQNARWFGLIFDNMKFGRYACSVEFLDTEQYADEHQYLDGIGTICHEFSHVLGLADHYDTDYAENGQAKAPGDWDIMASGTDGNYGLNPVGYNAFERHVLGFATPKTLDVAGSYTINPLNTSNEFYILNTGTNKEDFYIENRQQTRWDRFLPGHGMLVWRADLTNDYVWENNYVNNVLGNEHFELLSEGHANDLTTNTFPALKSSKGQRKKILFPYDKESRLIPEDELKKDKNVYDYLSSNKEKLLQRSNEKDGKIFWYAFGRSQAIADTYKDKIAINSLVRNKDDFKFTEAPAGTGVYGGLYIISDTIPARQILEALKSDEFINYIALIGKYKSGGYYTYSSKEVKAYLDYKFNYDGGIMECQQMNNF